MIIDSDNPDPVQGDKPKLPRLSEVDGSIQFKIVYWGPGESGKTTNFHRLREAYHYIRLTDGYSVQTTDGRTLWQDSVFLSFNINTKTARYNLITQIVT